VSRLEGPSPGADSPCPARPGRGPPAASRPARLATAGSAWFDRAAMPALRPVVSTAPARRPALALGLFALLLAGCGGPQATRVPERSAAVPAGFSRRSVGVAEGSARAGVAAEAWLGTVRTWGSLHEALGEGRTDERVDALAVARRGTYGVGAVAGLGGEITLLDGEVIVTRADDAGRPTSTCIPVGGGGHGPVPAAMLFVTHAAIWYPVIVEEDIGAEDLAATIRDLARRHRIATDEPFAFQVVGALTGIEYHVMRGACPVRARLFGEALAPERRPFQASAETLLGELVGVYGEGQGGRLTHHGEDLHMHVVFEGAAGERHTAHVERAGVAAGSTIYLQRSVN
jgi:hypothetical protein